MSLIIVPAWSFWLFPSIPHATAAGSSGFTLIVITYNKDSSYKLPKNKSHVLGVPTSNFWVSHSVDFLIVINFWVLTREHKIPKQFLRCWVFIWLASDLTASEILFSISWYVSGMVMALMSESELVKNKITIFFTFGRLAGRHYDYVLVLLHNVFFERYEKLACLTIGLIGYIPHSSLFFFSLFFDNFW